MKQLRDAVPLTAAGVLIAGLGVAAYVAGWRLGWVELMVLAAGSLLAVVAAVPFVVGRIRIELRRAISPPRVVAGDRSLAVLTVRNPGRAPSRPIVVDDGVDGRWQPVPVRSLAPGESQPFTYELPTRRRGVVTVGPAVVARADPLRLMRREVRHADAELLWVHPRWRPLPPLSVGFAKDLEGPTSDTSPAGDVAFHALREYELGDDYRHIHWMSTARANKPMVRHYVDNRRPELLVMLDDRESTLAGERFEVAMEIVASLAVSSIAQAQPLAVWTNDGPLVGRSRPGSRDDVLDRLAAAEPVAGGRPAHVAMTGLRTEPRVSALLHVTGVTDAHELAVLAAEARRRVRVVIVRVWPRDEIAPGRIPGARTIDVDSLDGFARAWQGLVR